nr:crossover junction endonuclease mus81 [Ipomoea batatas]
METEREVACSENEELAAYMWKMAEDKRGISDNIYKTLHKAYTNVCNSKAPIKTLRELSQIKGVGKWILKLMQGFFETDSEAPGNENLSDKGKKRKGTRRYMPQRNSVAYALIITLYRALADGKEFMRKQELIDAAEASGLSRAPIGPEKGKGKPGIGNSPRDWYSGWSCMKTLVTKGLVVKSSCPAKYMLTEEGKETARECLSRSGIVTSDQSLVNMEEFSNLDGKVMEDEGFSEKDMSDVEIESESSEKQVALPCLQLGGQKKVIDIPPGCLDRFMGMGFSKEQITLAFSKVSETSQGKDISSLWPTVLCQLREDQVYGLSSSTVEERVVKTACRGPSDDPKSSSFADFKQNSTTLLAFPSPALSVGSKGGEYSEAKSSILSMPPLTYGERSHSRKIVENISMQFKIRIEVRRLPVGDAIWIARHKNTGSEYVLDFIVERKKVDDLRSSIRDNRYKDQKLRLLRCGLKKMIYVVEGDANVSEAAESIKTACFTTEILEGFDVQRTAGLGDTLRKYGYLTQAIDHYYKSMEDKHKSPEMCPPFKAFIRRCEDLDKMTVSDVFAIQLMQVQPKDKPVETTRSAVGTEFQMRSELPAVPNTIDVLQTPEADLATAGNFKFTTELLENGSIGFWRRRQDTCYEPTPIEIQVTPFYEGIMTTLHGFLRRLFQLKVQISDPTAIQRCASIARVLACGCCITAYLKVKNIVTSELPARHTSNSLKMPRISDALAVPAGFAFAIQQLGAVNVADTLTERIFIPCFPNEGHSFGIPDDQLVNWNPNAYAEAVEYARTLGMRFHIVNLKKKDGTAWWLFRQHFAEGFFELQCPLPEVNFTKSMVVTHAQFLNGELANPSRAFVDLAPLGNDSFGVMMRSPHLGINLSCYEAISQEATDVVSNV